MNRLEEATAAGSGVVLVQGEAGIGKSRLISEFISNAESAGDSDYRSLIANCLPLPEPFPMGPVIEALRRAGEKDITSLRLSDLAGALRPVFPEWALYLPRAPESLDDPAAVKHRLFRAFDELLSALDVNTLVVEDAHWADQNTLEFLLFRWSQPDRPGVLVLTYRPQEVPASSLLRKFETRAPTGARRLSLSLDPLSPAGIRDLILHTLDTDAVSDEFANFLHHHTGGIPFVTEETLNLLRDRGDIVRCDDAWVRRTVEDLAIPATVGASITERVERLMPAARRALEAAAVLGRVAGEKSLRAVSGLNAGQAQQGLEKAVASGLLNEVRPGRFELRHALAGRAIYDKLPAVTRRRMHKRAACILEKSKPLPIAELARHLKHADELRRWADYAEKSADHAVTTGDDRTAALLLHEILNTASLPLRERGRLGYKLARAAIRGGAELPESTLDDIVRQLSEILDTNRLPVTERGRLRCEFGMLLLTRVDPRKAVAEFTQCVDELEEAPTQMIWTISLLCKPWNSGWPPAERRQWLERAVRLLPCVSDRTEQICLAADCALSRLELDQTVDWDTVEKLFTEAAGSLRTARQTRTLVGNYAALAYMGVLWGRQERVDDWLERGCRLTEAVPSRMAQRMICLNRAWLHYYTGRWAGLAEAANRVVGDGVDLAGRLESRILQGLLAIAADDVREGERMLRSVIREYRGSAYFTIPMIASAALARLYLTEQRPGEALEQCQEIVRRIIKAELWPWTADFMPVYVEALVRTGDLAPAEDLVVDFEKGLRGHDAPAAVAALLVCRAHLAAARGEHAGAAELFGRASAAWAALPRPYEELLAAECQASSLLAAGERKRALELLAEIERRLLDLGARRDADRVAELLRKHDVEVTRTWRRGRKSYGKELSPREREVIDFIARGNTNKQIAKSLLVSPTTIASHATSAMRKLGVSSRTELVSAAAESGLLEAGG